MVFRIYVEKRPGFDIQAEQLRTELTDILGVTSLTGLRMLNRYDVEGIDDRLFAAATPTVFSEPPVDLTYETLPADDGATVFAVEYLPGQFDQRADSASECIQLISQGERPAVRTATVYMLRGALSASDVESIKRYVINPVEAREASLKSVTTLHTTAPTPSDVEVLTDFTALDDAGLSRLIKERGLAMDLADARFCQRHFTDEGREPTITEIKVIDTYWSDHCRHTTFGTELDEVAIDDAAVREAFDRYLAMRRELGRENRPVCLMDMATIGAKWLASKGRLTGLDESEEINACTVKITVDVDGYDEDWLFLFKNETHNHPTEIEPFGGAATCIGGCIRDPSRAVPMSIRPCASPARATPRCRSTRRSRASSPSARSSPPPRRDTPPTATRSGWPPVRSMRSIIPVTSPSAWRWARSWPRRPPTTCAARHRPPVTPSSCSAAAPDATASEAPPGPRKASTSIPSTSWAPKCRRATPPWNASCSGSSAARTPADSSNGATISVRAASR